MNMRRDCGGGRHGTRKEKGVERIDDAGDGPAPATSHREVKKKKKEKSSSGESQL